MKQITQKSKRFNRKVKTKNFQEYLAEVPDKNGMYPIHIVVLNNDLGTLEDLIDKGANINKYNANKDTPLLLAIKENNLQIVEKLLEVGADLNKCDMDQNFPIDVAANLKYQECIDLLTEYRTSQNKTATMVTKQLSDSSVEFIEALIILLDDNVVFSNKPNTAGVITEKILSLLKQYLHLKKIPSAINAKLHQNIEQRIFQFLSTLKNNISNTKKDILNLARKIIVLIQEFKKSLSKDSVWNLNKIESLIEEKIVNSNTESEKLSAYVFNLDSASKNQDVQSVKSEEGNWYSCNGYKNLDEFIKVNNLGAGSIEFLKFSIIEKEVILQKTCNNGTEALEVVTIKPLRLTTEEAFSLLIPDALERIKEEQELFEYSSYEWELLNKLLSKVQKGIELSLDESSKLDRVLRPGKKDKIHLVHFHHIDGYEPFWHDFTKEAFLTGATMHLFNHPPTSSEKTDIIYAGIAIVNNILDQDIHPDKIILQSYGDGYYISREVRDQFLKRGINLTQINYQHSLFSPIIYQECMCGHRELNINFGQICEKTIQKEEVHHEFLKFAKYIVARLKESCQDKKNPYLTTAVSKNYSLTQLINIFISSVQRFLKENMVQKNPPLPQERVENILGIINV